MYNAFTRAQTESKNSSTAKPCIKILESSDSSRSSIGSVRSTSDNGIKRGGGYPNNQS